MNNQQTNNHVFQTEYLPLACYLHAAKKLKFIGANPKPDGIVEFKFEDKQNKGEQLHSDFEGGAECSATAFYHSLRYLRRVIDLTRGARNGKNDDGISNCNTRANHG